MNYMNGQTTASGPDLVQRTVKTDVNLSVSFITTNRMQDIKCAKLTLKA